MDAFGNGPVTPVAAGGMSHGDHSWFGSLRFGRDRWDDANCYIHGRSAATAVGPVEVKERNEYLVQFGGVLADGCCR